jgi:hypothetical protein
MQIVLFNSIEEQARIGVEVGREPEGGELDM